MDPVGFVVHPVFLQHAPEVSHPEHPLRLVSILNHLAHSADAPPLVRMAPEPAPESAVERNHFPGYIAFVKERKPTLTFVHCDHVDHAGHKYGHGTPQYYEAVAQADVLVGKMLAALKEAGIADRTIVLVTADHGGVAKGHGGSTMAELEIPWILAGPGVAQGRELRTPVRTYDTAATVASILGVKPPDCWIARPVLEAFLTR